LPSSRISTPASFGSQGNPKGRLAAALTASLPGVDTSQPGKGIHVYLAVRLQLIKARCSALSKTCAAVIEKTVLPFSIPIKILDTRELHSLLLKYPVNS